MLIHGGEGHVSVDSDTHHCDDRFEKVVLSSMQTSSLLMLARLHYSKAIWKEKGTRIVNVYMYTKQILSYH